MNCVNRYKTAQEVHTKDDNLKDRQNSAPNEFNSSIVEENNAEWVDEPQIIVKNPTNLKPKPIMVRDIEDIIEFTKKQLEN